MFVEVHTKDDLVNLHFVVLLFRTENSDDLDKYYLSPRWHHMRSNKQYWCIVERQSPTDIHTDDGFYVNFENT